MNNIDEMAYAKKDSKSNLLTVKNNDYFIAGSKRKQNGSQC